MSLPGTLDTLVLARSITTTASAHSTASFGSVSILFGVLVLLWAMSAVSIGIALVPGLYASSTLPMARTGCTIGILFGVLVPLWAMSNVGLPVQPIPNSVSIVFDRSAPVQVAEIVIVAIVIFMAAIGFRRRSWSDKRLKHQYMNHHLLRSAIQIQSAGMIPVSLYPARHCVSQYAALENSSSSPSSRADPIQRPNPSSVRNLITKIAKHRTPTFLTGHDSMITSCSKEH